MYWFKSPLTRRKLKNILVINKINAFIKAYLQKYTAEKSLSKYRQIAAQRAISSPQGDALKKALRARLNSRSQGRWPKKKADLHIFLSYYVSNWEAILPKALMPFGKVTAFNWHNEGFDHNASNWLQLRNTMNAVMLEHFHKANRAHQVDAVVGYLSGYNTAPETLQEMAKSGAAIFNFCWDDKLNFPGKPVGGRFPTPAANAHVVDLNLTNAPDSVVKYAVHGGLAMFWPPAGHPDVHRPYELPFEYDVSFVGACYGMRPKFINSLKKKGIEVICFGQGWPNGTLSDEEMVKLYSRSRINLGFAGIGYSFKLMCLKGRDFEVPISGGLYMTQNNPELNRVFDIGSEIVTYDDKYDCAEKIKTLLNNPERAASIRIAGRKRCLKDHTYENRWDQIFAMAGIVA